MEEAEAEDGAAEGEVVLGRVEEEVALVEGFEVEGSEESGEAEVSGGGEEAELDFDFHGGGLFRKRRGRCGRIWRKGVGV